MRLSELQDIIQKYRNGTASQEEIRLVEIWFLRSEKDPAVFSEEALKQTEDRILQKIRSNLVVGKRPTFLSRLRRIPFLRVASIFLLLTGIGLAGYLYRRAIADFFDPVEMKMVKSNEYEIKRIYLPDSTLVTLHHNSSISYPARYRSRLREVTLSGKGYFRVTKNPDHPFVVHTQDINVQVLGTSFVVDDRLQDSAVIVSVLTGSVNVSLQQQSLAVLAPNESISYYRRSGTFNKKDLEAGALLSWIDKQLVFEKTELSQVLEALRRQYHVTIHAPHDMLKGKVFTGEFTSKDSLRDVMDIIAISSGFNYRLKDSAVVITP